MTSGIFRLIIKVNISFMYIIFILNYYIIFYNSYIV